MNDKTTESQSMGQDELSLTFDGQSMDWYLQKLVSIVNTSSLEFGITLLVNGAVVSGVLIGGKRYFDEFAKEFSEAYPGTPESKENIRQSLASHGEIYECAPEGELPPPQFIHLADSRCFSTSGRSIPTDRGVLWRGKINSISGFSLGRLSGE